MEQTNSELPPLKARAWIFLVLRAMVANFAKSGEAVVNHIEMNRIRDKINRSPPKIVEIMASGYKPGQEEIIFGEQEVE